MQLICIFVENRELLERIFYHYYSRSISDIFSKLIEAEDSNGFYEKEKNSFINLLPAALEREKDI